MCGTISKSTTTSYGGIACGCSTGYIWDVMTNTCIKECTDSIANCMNCKKIPNTNTAKVAAKGNSSTYRNFTGG